MSKPGRNRRRSRSIKRLLVSPIYALGNALTAIKELVDAILQVFGLKWLRTRRNRNFEKAGREVPRVDSFDSGAAANLERADRERDREILQQISFENRVLRRNNKEGEALRRAMQEENRSVSSGDAISHLAKMNQREKQRNKQEREQAQKQNSQNKAPQNQSLQNGKEDGGSTSKPASKSKDDESAH